MENTADYNVTISKKQKAGLITAAGLLLTVSIVLLFSFVAKSKEIKILQNSCETMRNIHVQDSTTINAQSATIDRQTSVILADSTRIAADQNNAAQIETNLTLFVQNSKILFSNIEKK